LSVLHMLLGRWIGRPFRLVKDGLILSFFLVGIFLLLQVAIRMGADSDPLFRLSHHILSQAPLVLILSLLGAGLLHDAMQ